MVVAGGAGGESSSARAATPRANPDRRWSARDKATQPIRPAGGDRRECGLSARAHPVDDPTRPAALQPAARCSVVAPVRRPADGLDGHALPRVPPAVGAACAAVHGDGACERREIGRSHVSTPVTNAPLVCRLLLEKKKTNQKTKHITYNT